MNLPPSTPPPGGSQSAPAGAPQPAPDNAHDAGSVEHGNEHIHWRRRLQYRLLLKLVVPAVIGLVQLGIACFDVATGRASLASFWWAVPALLVGYLFGRMTHVSWEGVGTQVALVGGQLILTAAYVVVRIGSHVVLRHTLQGSADQAAVLLLVSFGLFLGYSIGLITEVRKRVHGGAGVS